MKRSRETSMNFARFLFFNHFPKVDRVIYLDWDMLVFADLLNLLEHYKNNENMIVANCGNQSIFTNIFVPNFRFESNINSIYYSSSRMKLRFHRCNIILKKLNIDYRKMFKSNGFNAGFYIVSKNHFEENYMIELIEKLIEIQKTYKCFNFGTQVVMNLMHVDNRTFIDKEWNHLPNVENIKELKIVHWNGKNKPWNSDENNKSNDVWREYYLKIYPETKSKIINKSKIIKPNEKITKKSVRNIDLIKILSRN